MMELLLPFHRWGNWDSEWLRRPDQSHTANKWQGQDSHPDLWLQKPHAPFLPKTARWLRHSRGLINTCWSNESAAPLTKKPLIWNEERHRSESWVLYRDLRGCSGVSAKPILMSKISQTECESLWKLVDSARPPVSRAATCLARLIILLAEWLFVHEQVVLRKQVALLGLGLTCTLLYVKWVSNDLLYNIGSQFNIHATT